MENAEFRIYELKYYFTFINHSNVTFLTRTIRIVTVMLFRIHIFPRNVRIISTIS